MYVELTFPSGLIARVDNEGTWSIVSDDPDFIAELLASASNRPTSIYAPQTAMIHALTLIKERGDDPPKITANTFDTEVAEYPNVN